MPLLSVSDLSTHYTGRSGTVRAVDQVSFTIERGETVALVGESGCGKSSLGKAILRLAPAQGGQILFRDDDLTRIGGERLRGVRRSIQMVFQDAFASLNPRQKIRDILTGPLEVHRIGTRQDRTRRIEQMIDRVGLPRDALDRYPHEFSGGQRQRIGIARALILNPELIVCDEPVSALDLSIQAQILNLLAEMKAEFGLSYLFISHDLSVVRYFADRILVMYLGRIVESGEHSTFWSQACHPYTRALMEAVPDPSRRRQAAQITGDLPSPANVPSGCRFHPRCPLATDICRSQEPAPRSLSAAHQVACHHVA